LVESESEFGEPILVAVDIDGVGQGLVRLIEEVMSTELHEHVQRLLSSDIHRFPSLISTTLELKDVEAVGDHDRQRLNAASRLRNTPS
jgi:hypothetical protein